MESNAASPESDLLSAAGDEGALPELLARYGPVVRRGLAGKIDERWRSLLSADDVIQETNADAFWSIRRFIPRGDAAFLRWLTTLAKSNLRDAIKGLKTAKKGGDRVRVHSRACDESYVELFVELSGTASTPSRVASRKEAEDLLNEALTMLPSAYQHVVKLYDLEERSAYETAQILGCSPGRCTCVDRVPTRCCADCSDHDLVSRSSVSRSPKRPNEK